MSLKKISLKNKILLFVFLIYTIICIISFYVIISHSEKILLSHRVKSIKTLVKNYTNDIKYLVLINNKNILKKILNELMKVGYIDFIKISKNGKIFCSFYSNHYINRNSPESLSKILILKIPDIKNPSGKNYLTIHELSILIGYNLSDLKQELKHFKIDLFKIGFVSMLIFGLLMYILLTKFFSQIEYINKAMITLSKGSFSKINIKVDKEFKNIVNTFNKLVDSLKIKDKEIKKHISDIKERNKKLKEQIAEIKALQEILITKEKLAGLGTLAAGIAHEINNPIAAIKGFCELKLIKDNADPKVFKKIIHYCDRVSNIVKKLKSFGKSASNEVIELLEINKIIEEAIESLKLSKMLGDIEMKGNFKKTRVLLRCKRGEMYQLFLNLIKNSVEAMNGKGEIKIDILDKHDQVEIHFIDNGPGIPEEIRDKIFEPFFTTKFEEGMGLGLYICKKIVNDHNGYIKLLDNNGKNGSYFLISFLKE